MAAQTMHDTSIKPMLQVVPMKSGAAAETTADGETGTMTARFQANRNLRERLRRVAVWQEKRMRAHQERARKIFELAWRADLNPETITVDGRERRVGRIEVNGKLWWSTDLRRVAETISAQGRAAEGYANGTWGKYNAVTAKHGVRFMRGWPAAVLAKAAADLAAAKAEAHRQAAEEHI